MILFLTISMLLACGENDDDEDLPATDAVSEAVGRAISHLQNYTFELERKAQGSVSAVAGCSSDIVRNSCSEPSLADALSWVCHDSFGLAGHDISGSLAGSTQRGPAISWRCLSHAPCSALAPSRADDIDV